MAAKTIRCPDCNGGKLHTMRITVRQDTCKTEALPVKVCPRCKLLVPTKKAGAKWRLWDGHDYVELAT